MLVAVILVIVLGIVSFSNMTPDLLPSIDLPYVLVLTTSPGSSPEEVEENLTRPISSSMATLDNIASVSGTSNENYSMVILQFADGSNMDTVTIDIREKLNMLAGSWEDTVGTPVILKLNPDMLPVMVAAVDYEGEDIRALSRFAEDTLSPRLESIEGVASVSMSGLLKETVLVTLDDSRLDALNARVRAALDKTFDDALREIQDARGELTGKTGELDGKRAEIADGRTQLENARKTLDEQMQSARDELGEKRTELVEAKRQLIAAQQQLLDQREQLMSAYEKLLPFRSAAAQLSAAESTLRATAAQYRQLQAQIDALESAMQGYESEIARIEADASLTEQEKQAAIEGIRGSEEYRQTEEGLAAIDAQLAAEGMTRADIPRKLAETEAALKALEESAALLDKQLADYGITVEDIPDTLRQMEEGLAQIDAAKEELASNLQLLEDGLITVDDARASLPAAQLDATLQIYEGMSQLSSGELALESAAVQLDDALAQLDDAEKELEQRREEAYKQADLSAKLNRDTIAPLLYAQNFAMPAGYIADGANQYLVRVGDKLSGVEELSSLVLFDTGDDLIGPVYLTDAARVEVVDNSGELYAKINGREGVLLSFNKQSGYATAEVAGSVSRKFRELSAEYDGLTFTELMNQGDYIGLVVDSVLQNLLVGAVLAVGILLLFLRDVRPTLIIACSIPVSVTFAIVLMYFSGVTMNIISLSGLAVGVGMLVDNSIVVIENIYRMRSEGMSAVRASVQGAKQVAAAITSSTLTTVCVFFPIVFVEGLTRQLFMDMALTITYSLMASLIVALTLVPAMASGVLRREAKKSKKSGEGRLMRAYRRSIDWALSHKAAVLLGSLVLLIVSALPAVSRGFSYMPEMTSSQIMLTVETEKGSTLEETASVSDAMASDLLGIDGVDTVGAMLSGGMGSVIGLSVDTGNTTSVTMYVLLRDGVTDTDRVLAEMREVCGRYPCETSITANTSMMGSTEVLGGSGVSLRVYGSDLDQLQQTALDLAAQLSEVEGCVNAQAQIGETTPELRVTVDKSKAAEKGLTVAQVFQSLAASLKTEVTATTLTVDGDGRDVVIVTSLDEALEKRLLTEYEVAYTGMDGEEKTVRLGEIAQISETQTPALIRRSALGRYIEVTAELDEGYNVTLVTAAAQRALADYPLPAGQQLVFTGENETIMASMQDLGLMLLLGVVIVYLIMVAQFQSLLSPLIVMFTIPLAFTGSFFALWLAGMDLSVVAMIGLVMLVGIIVNNGIVLVDYTNQLRREGKERRAAVAEAAATRLRPILMTAITTVLGLLPLGLGMGMGASLVQPVAVVCIGGLVYATLMTLYVVPALYDLLARRPLRNIRDEDIDAEAEGRDLPSAAESRPTSGRPDAPAVSDAGEKEPALR